jgi:antitoxin PrlF
MVHECSFSAILHSMRTTVAITSRGVITLPAKLRQALGLKADDHLIAEITSEGLLLRPAVTLPVELYSAERQREFDLAESELATRFAQHAPRPRRATRPAAKTRR